MRQKFIDAYMDVAKRFAQLSSAKRLQVGAIVVKDDRIISIGYNGMPAGWTNECETVLDNTMGSGSTGVACINTNRHFIGIELEKKYFDLAKERLDNHQKI